MTQAPYDAELNFSVSCWCDDLLRKRAGRQLAWRVIPNRAPMPCWSGGPRSGGGEGPGSRSTQAERRGFTVVPNLERVVRERIRVLEDIPHEDLEAELKECARLAVKALLGEIAVVEEGGHVVAEIDLERVVYTVGAEKRT